MSDDRTKKMNWRRIARALSANPTVLAISATGFVVEATLLLSFATYPSFSLMLATITLLLWIWLTNGWLVHFAIRFVFHSSKGRSASVRLLAWTVLVSTVAVCLFAYLASWAFYFRSERFATIENARFFWANMQTPVLWWYFVTSEPVSLIAVLMAVVTASGLLVMHAKRIAASIKSIGDPSRLASMRRTVWWSQLLTVALLVIYLFAFDPIDSRRFQGMDWLARRVNPVVSLVVSLAETRFDTPIEPCLDEADLVSLETPWYPPSDTVREKASVIFIAVESLRWDAVHQEHQGRKVMPHLSELAEQSVQFTRAYTQSTHSDYADVAVLSSLYPLRTRHHHYYQKNDPWPKKLIYDLLKQDSYRTAIVSAQNEAWGGMSYFLETPGLDLFYDAERSGLATLNPGSDSGFAGELEAGTLTAGKLDDRDVTRRAIQWIDENSEVPFFLSINFQSSHFPYLLSEPVDRPFVPCAIDFDASFMYYPPEKTEVVRNAYFNALHLIDQQIGKIAQLVKDLEKDRPVILVVYGENGEAFHENGCVTHAKPPFEPMVHVPWVLYAPMLQQARSCDYPVQLIDVVPTILGLLGLPKHANLQGIDVLSQDRPPLEHRDIFLHTELQGVSRVDAIVHAGRWKLHHDREQDRFMLFDLHEDPEESQDLVNNRPDVTRELIERLRKWRSEQLAYYHFPHYFMSFYPP